MSRYRPKHSAELRERERTRPVRVRARAAAVVAGALLVAGVGLVIATGGGWDEAVRTFSGEELKEREAELRSQFESASPEATASSETPAP